VSGFLLDTNVLSEFSRSAFPPDPNVKRWMELADPNRLFTSVLSFGEIRKGIELLPFSKKRNALERWLDADLNGWFGDNLLPITKSISAHWGKIVASSQQQGRQLGNIDGLLAATALEYNLTIVTRNIRHFEALGVAILNPWQS
jgi:predicted nucleic acid-binding protein